MTRTISLITATVGAALLFAVPAYGDNWGADQRSQPVGYLSPDSGDRAAALQQQKVTDMLDARERAQGVSVENSVAPVDRERALGTKNELSLSSDFYADGFAQALQPRFGTEPVATTGSGSIPTVALRRSRSSSGTEIEWPQVGIGFGIGLVLALGLYLAMRFTRIRPLAH